MILALKTDQADSAIFLVSENWGTYEYKWYAHRELSNTLFEKIEALLKRKKANQADIKGIVVYTGPGSFTGLRIGITVANTLSYSLNIPIVGTNGEDWLDSGVKKITNLNYSKKMTVFPEYGAEAHITKPRK